LCGPAVFRGVFYESSHAGVYMSIEVYIRVYITAYASDTGGSQQ
jgi:hypothetical protein